MKPGLLAPTVITGLFLAALGTAWWNLERAADNRTQARQSLIQSAQQEHRRLVDRLHLWRSQARLPTSALECLESAQIAVSGGRCLWPSGSLLPIERLGPLLDDQGRPNQQARAELEQRLSHDPWLVHLWIRHHPGLLSSPNQLEDMIDLALEAASRNQGQLHLDHGVDVQTLPQTDDAPGPNVWRARRLPPQILTSGDARLHPTADAGAALWNGPLDDTSLHWGLTPAGRLALDQVGDRQGALVSLVLAGAVFVFGIRFLQKSRQHLAQQAALRERLVADISHELRTPVTTLRLYAEMLRDGRITGDDKRRDYCDSMVRESGRLGRLIDNVLDFSKLNQGTLEMNLSLVRPDDLDRRLREALVGLEGAETLEIDLHDGDLVQADPEASLRILMNLVGNALKYAPGSPVRITFEKGPPPAIVIEDDGPGINPEEAATLFDPFVRGHQAQKDQIRGTGLGLAIARDLARAQGGELLWVPTKQGARFELRFAEGTSA